MKQLILTNWNWWRVLRMALSLLFIGVGLWRSDFILTLSGGFLFFHALHNACATCVGGSCNTK